MGMSVRKNYDVFDAVKFTLSILIVLLHSGTVPEILLPVVRTAVPLFFIISSYLLFSKKGQQMKYAVAFSIPAHEKFEVIVDQITNINHFNPNCAIVLHISKKLRQMETVRGFHEKSEHSGACFCALRTAHSLSAYFRHRNGGFSVTAAS